MARTARNIGKAPDASMSVAITNTDGARLPHPNQRTKLPMTPRMASAPMDQSMLRHRRTRSGLLSWSRSTCILSSEVGRVLRASHHTPPREQRHHPRVTVRMNEGCHWFDEYPCRRKATNHRHAAHHHPLRRRLQPLQRNGAVRDRAPHVVPVADVRRLPRAAARASRRAVPLRGAQPIPMVRARGGVHGAKGRASGEVSRLTIDCIEVLGDDIGPYSPMRSLHHDGSLGYVSPEVDPQVLLLGARIQPR